jgi:hypothetical protein
MNSAMNLASAMNFTSTMKIAFMATMLTNVTHASKCFYPAAKIIYVNGVFNTREKALFSNALLRKNFANSFSENTQELIGDHKLSHNMTSYVWDLFQSAAQLREEYIIKFWSYIENLEVAPEDFREQAKKLIKAQLEQSSTFVGDIQNHIDMYKYYLDHEQPLVVLSHSQGNFYTNSALTNLNLLQQNSISPQEIFRPIGIANPSSFVVFGGPHTTLVSDWVIRLIPGSMSPNVDNNSSGLFDHEFYKHYILGKNSGPHIRNSVEKALLDLKAKERIAKDDDHALSKTCLNWFARLHIPSTVPENECLSECTTGMVGMNDFSCPSSCEDLCKCGFDIEDYKFSAGN